MIIIFLSLSHYIFYDVIMNEDSNDENNGKDNDNNDKSITTKIMIRKK